MTHTRTVKTIRENKPRNNLYVSTKAHTPEPYTNNTQQYEFNDERSMAEQRIETKQINAIMDTGATFTMLPGHFDFAWTNLKPCLHTIEGCFEGGKTNSETQIGEFHALITLDSGET